jgi:predicted TIM-barrel fold metal-dependent hydrolase
VDASTLPKISADSHVDEPHDLWFDRLPVDMREHAVRRIQADEDGGWTLVVDGSPIGWNDISSDEAARRERERLDAASIPARHEMMRIDGINGEIVYPTIGLYCWNVSDPRVGRACCEIYNDWILERLGGDDRIRVAIMLPTWDIDMTVREIERLADHPSVGGLLAPLVGDPEWNLPGWEPLWDVVSATGKPLVMHQGTGHDMIFYRGWGSPTANLLATQSMAPRAAALFSCSGILERHPDLHVVLVEVNAGWMAWADSTLDEYYQAHATWAKVKLAEPPSHYIRRQVHATFQNDPVAIHNLPLTGSGPLLWGNDFPHPEATYPNSNKVLEALLAGVDEADAVAITSGNALRLFGFEPSILETAP